MKKPVEAIERMRRRIESADEWRCVQDDGAAILAYLDSIKEWPVDLTRERLEEYADRADEALLGFTSSALRRLAELAPVREKRMATLWKHDTDGWQRWTEDGKSDDAVWINAGYRKVGGPYEIED